ncbi:hypothetical protein ACFQMA_18730 [Halosimplex aquaticum]|uniref:Uncharacterized protein n=1 Tax=Halosimplex aquaticum TaxID=3026162 RepID=A0ABD5Y8J8_9EURY|nr:hypothetical protein [Halosimplex aquaticum]
MDRLSSCYFCGAALDATLEERPVVPSTLHPSTDSQKTVVLCVTCQRKLDAVLGTVLDAVEADAGDVSPDASTGAERTSDDRTDGSAATADESTAAGGDLESTLGDDEDILTPVGEDDGTGEDGGDDSDDEAEGDSAVDRSKKPKYTDSRGAGFRREDDGPVETGSLTGGAFSDDDEDDSSDSGSLTGDAFADDGSASEDRSSGTGQSSGAAGNGSGSVADSGSASSGDGGTGASGDGASGGGSTGDGGSGPQRDVSMTRLENTKVMRLLENREFPVDRDEFVTVAANAYQVSRDDCDKVIDLAVEHGLLREESGQLYGGDS